MSTSPNNSLSYICRKTDSSKSLFDPLEAFPWNTEEYGPITEAMKPGVKEADFMKALAVIRPSVSEAELSRYEGLSESFFGR